jgi:glycosyltransferase involved in cell wall biosynthesis/peptidoglycan/xylan/chitin deacetylase (PgdA/CDA1 family)
VSISNINNDNPKPTVSGADTYQPVRVSVIIPTYQRRDVVVNSVRALANQKFNNLFEVVVVVDGSQDGSARALRGINPIFPLTVVEQPNKGRAAALNHGAQVARGEIFLFLDDDMEAHPQLIAEHDQSHRGGAALVLGHIPLHSDSPDNFLSAAVAQWTEERCRRLSTPGARLNLHDLITGQASVSRGAFESLGGFDMNFNLGGTFGNEDLDFCYRLRCKGLPVVFNPSAISWQKYVVTPRHNLRQWRQAGRADVVFARKHPDQAGAMFAQHPPEPRISRLFATFLRRLTLFLIDIGVQHPTLTDLFFRVRELEYRQGARAAGGMPRSWPVRVLAYHAIADLAGDPILEEYGIPAAIFQEQLKVLQKAGYHFISADEFLRYLNGSGGLPRDPVLLTFDDCYEDNLTTALPILEAKHIPAVAFAVSRRLGSTNDWDEKIGAVQIKLLDAEGLKALQAANVEIGAHSQTHRPLNQISVEELPLEVGGAIADLEAAGLKRPRLFSYPHGEYNQDVQRAVRDAGLQAAFTVESNYVQAYQNPYRIPRIEIFRADTGLKLRWKIARAGRPLIPFNGAAVLHRIIGQRISLRPMMKKARIATTLDTRVSVVVPAYNAADTLDETLASLKAQTFPNWEAIIVDDGSSDDTPAIAARWAQQDNRFRFITQKNGGEAAARNTGIREAKNPWLAYLDSDDWVAPEYMALMIKQVIANPRLDAVVCGCARVMPSGQQGAPAIYGPYFLVDPFPEFAVDCPFAIHNCMIRRSLIAEIGDFDESLDTCADWDFWQRVARAGSRFGTVPKVLAYYRIRPGSSSSRAERVLLDGFKVIRRGHRPDPRVVNPHPKYTNGLPLAGMSQAMFRHSLWPASLMLGQGKDARPLLKFMGKDQASQLDPEEVAQNLFDSIPLAAAVTSDDWPNMWPVLEERLLAYLTALETQSQAVGLAQQSVQYLERMTLDAVDLTSPLTIGTAYGVCIDLDRKITDVIIPEGMERLYCKVMIAGQDIGFVQLPVYECVVTSKTIAETITTDLARPLLLSYFHLSPPPGSELQNRLYKALEATRPLSLVYQLMPLSWAFCLWQFQHGLPRRPALLKQFCWMVLKMRPLRFILQLVNARHQSRRDQVKQFLINMAQRFVQEEGLVLAT